MSDPDKLRELATLMKEALKEKGEDHFSVKRDNNGVDIEIL